jgi:hypothetical protein
MREIPPGFYSWAAPVGIVALVAIIVMTVRGWISSNSPAHKKRRRQRSGVSRRK